MKTDSSGRRIRSKRQPLKAQDHQIQERDLLWVNFLLRHGNLLSIDYLHEASKPEFINLTKSNDRQNRLFNELKLLDRPKQQFDPTVTSTTAS